MSSIYLVDVIFTILTHSVLLGKTPVLHPNEIPVALPFLAATCLKSWLICAHDCLVTYTVTCSVGLKSLVDNLTFYDSSSATFRLSLRTYCITGFLFILLFGTRIRWQISTFITAIGCRNSCVTSHIICSVLVCGSCNVFHLDIRIPWKVFLL